MGIPLVSVCIFTYNYEKYLHQAVDSIVKQQCDFSFEILICDDCSTDDTVKIALQYQMKYPDLIRVLEHNENQGGTKNWIRAIQACRGKYISLIDGDDYFSDAFKIKKQAAVMEQDENLVLCFHSVDEIYDDAPELNKTVTFEKEKYELSDFIRNGWFVRTSSTFFKNGIIPTEMPDWVHDFPYRFDTILHVLLCQHGYACNIKQSMSVWRKHKNGMSFRLMDNQIKNAYKKIALAKKLNEVTAHKYQKESNHFISQEFTFLNFYLIRNFIFWKYPMAFINSFLKMDTLLFLKLLKGKKHGIKNA
jgi:glycosyltransferase involved in cell wall biosynthesis